MSAIALSAVLVFFAELGDKSQLMCMTFATRYRARTVIIGAIVATAVMNLVSALAGDLIGDAMPERGIRIASGVLFLLFALLTLKDLDGDDDVSIAEKAGRSAVLVVALAFALSELGDKTMLATMTLATQYHWVWIWIGSVLGMSVSIVLAVLAGRALLRVVPVRVVHLVSAALFAGLGIWMLLG